MAIIPGNAAPFCLIPLPMQFKMYTPSGHSVVHFICDIPRASQAGPAAAHNITVSTAGKTRGLFLAVC